MKIFCIVFFRFKCVIEEGYSDGEEDFYFNEIDLDEDECNDSVFLLFLVLFLILI